MSGRINIYLRNGDSPWKWNVMMSLNCWIIKKPHSDLCRYIKFHKPMQMAFPLPPSLCLWDSERRQEGHHLKNFSFMHLGSPLIYILFGKKRTEEEMVFSSFPQVLHVCAEGQILASCFLLLCPSFLHHSYYKNHIPVLLWLFFLLSWQTHYQIWRRKIKFFRRKCSVQNVQMDGSSGS